ncbi:MAG: 1,4-dihydroxy-2-naphthoate polyprenyltransferase [Ignavibacteria bacterium]|nr:MAG: 1,4-dihydroxy-2-naphthoate polyprenyltransferase [Ignavibacteria bacterium]
MASRPKTLLAAFVPVIIGSALAYSVGKFHPLAALVALVCSLLIQIGTNFVNDLYDYLAGTDNEERVGPTRVLAAGFVSVKEMKIAIALVFGLTFLLGLYLVYMGGWIILLIGVLSILAGIAYTAGPFPLAYNGLGDIFVFVFFGLIGTAGTYYVQALELSTLSILTAIPVGALITNILIVNNYRDIETDKANGKNTLAVIFGKKFSRLQYLFFLILSYSIPVFLFIFFKQSIFVFLPLLSLPLGIKLIKMIYTYEGSQLNTTLELTAKLSGIYGILFAAGLIL